MPLKCEPLTHKNKIKMSIIEGESSATSGDVFLLVLVVSGCGRVDANHRGVDHLRDSRLDDDDRVDGDRGLVSHPLVLSLELTQGALVAEGGHKTIVHQRPLVIENTLLCSVE